MESENQAKRYDTNVELDSNEKKRLENSRYSQLFRFSAKCYDDQQNLRNLPFESLELPITVEPRPSQFSMGDQAVVLTPKLNATALECDWVELNGYTLKASKSTSAVHVYQTTLGPLSARRNPRRQGNSCSPPSR